MASSSPNPKSLKPNGLPDPTRWPSCIDKVVLVGMGLLVVSTDLVFSSCFMLPSKRDKPTLKG